VFFGRNLLQVLMGEQLVLPTQVWRRLSVAWIAFFTFMGILNLYVAYSFDTATWVNFKLFGGIGLMLLFTLAQGLYLSRYIQDDAAPGPADPAGARADKPAD
jgi:intracellular septation protein